MADDDSLSETMVVGARLDVVSLASEGRWGANEDAELERRFGRATYDALRAPRLAERSVRLRRLARRTIPRPLRPKFRHALARVEHVYEVIRDRKERP